MDLARLRLDACDARFFSEAPLRYVGSFESPRPADQIWAELTRDGTLDWCRALSPVTWTSPRPFGVGATRRLRVLGALVLDEHYFEWVEGERKSFYVARASLPLFRRFAEKYVVEQLGADRSRFTWTLAAEPRGPVGPAAAVNRRLTSSLFRDTRRYLGAAFSEPEGERRVSPR